MKYQVIGYHKKYDLVWYCGYFKTLRKAKNICTKNFEKHSDYCYIVKSIEDPLNIIYEVK